MVYGSTYEQRSLLGTHRAPTFTSTDDVDIEAVEDAVARSSLTTSPPPWWLVCPREGRWSIYSKTFSSPHLPLHRTRRRSALFVRSLRRLIFLPHILLCLVLVVAVFFPSYTNPPPHYAALRHRVLLSNTTGAANPANQKIFIAASLYDPHGALLSGHWGRSVSTLIHILGPENVFLSLYENDPDSQSRLAMSQFERHIPCNASIVSQHLDTTSLPHLALPDGKLRLRRIPFLAEVRNRALRPLATPGSPAYAVRFDRLLYLNDVAFDPLDAANLLLNTNLDPTTGRANYRAACAVDFINPFKFYDIFATRDFEGNGMGLQFYPWFTGGASRADVLAQKDAVEVGSCWGGMTAFEARWFQEGLSSDSRSRSSTTAVAATADTHDDPDRGSSPGYQPPSGDPLDLTALTLATPSSSSSPNTHVTAPTLPLRFRAFPQNYTDASECCLIHADLVALPPNPTPGSPSNSAVYLNPFIRTAYTPTSHSWLAFTRRFERLYSIPHWIGNLIGGYPRVQPPPHGRPGSADVGAFCGEAGGYFIKEAGDARWGKDGVYGYIRGPGG